MRLPIYLALRNLLRHPGRNLLYILGVSITAALLLDMILLSNGLSISIEKMLRQMGYEVRVSPRGTLPFETDAQITQFKQIESRMLKMPAIASVDAMLGSNLLARHKNKSFTTFALGLQVSQSTLYKVVTGSDLQTKDRAILVNEYVAKDLGLRAGDLLSIRLPSRSNEPAEEDQEISFPIRGVAYFPLDGDGQLTIFMPLQVLQSFLQSTDTDPVSVIMIKLKNSRNADAVAKTINAEFPQLSAYTISSVIQAVDKQLSYFKQFSYILGGISLVVTFVLIFIITTISFHDRVGEIALLRAIGLSNRTISLTILCEGILTAIASAIAGLVLGKFAAIYLDMILKSAPGLPEDFSFFVMESRSIVRATLTLLLTGFFAGLYPAAAAARLPIAQTLREEIL